MNLKGGVATKRIFIVDLTTIRRTFLSNSPKLKGAIYNRSVYNLANYIFHSPIKGKFTGASVLYLANYIFHTSIKELYRYYTQKCAIYIIYSC